MALTAELVAELDALPEGAVIYADRAVPGLAYSAPSGAVWPTGEAAPESGPVGPEAASFDEADSLLDEVERAGYRVAR